MWKYLLHPSFGRWSSISRQSAKEYHDLFYNNIIERKAGKNRKQQQQQQEQEQEQEQQQQKR